MSAPARRLAEAQTAFHLLTRLPVGRVAAPYPSIAAARWAFPLCGLVVGGLAWGGFAFAAALGLPPAVAAWAAIGAGLLATGALHEDGLADFADGLGGGRDRESKLAIMRDSRIGSYGVLALLVALGARAACLGELAGATGAIGAAGAAGAAAFVGLAALSRGCMIVAADGLKPARADGLGRGMAAPAGGWRTWIGVALAVACAAPLGVPGLMAALAMAVAAATLAWVAKRQIGGQTGDVLGAIQAVAETTGWIALLAVCG